MVGLETAIAVAEKAGTATVETTKKIAETTKRISETAIKEVAKNQIENIKSVGDGVLSKLEAIKNLTPEQLQEIMKENIEKEGIDIKNKLEGNDGEEKIKEGLTDEEKVKIRKETDWSDEIIDIIGSMEEYEVYKNVALKEVEINGNKCLIRDDIDWNQKDAMGRTNYERAKQGLSPINKDGKVIELHHIGQHGDSPLAELTPQEHRGKGNDSILHDKTKESEIDRQSFAGERNNHWEARANERSN